MFFSWGFVIALNPAYWKYIFAICSLFSMSLLSVSKLYIRIYRTSLTPFYFPTQHIRPFDYQYFINKMVEKSVLHFFSSLNEYKISAFFWIMKASEKLCAKSFLRGWFEVYFGMCEIYCIAFCRWWCSRLFRWLFLQGWRWCCVL